MFVEFYLYFLDSQTCSQSHIEIIPDLKTCNGTSAAISIIFRSSSLANNCQSILDDDYHILLYHHNFQTLRDIQKYSPPKNYNKTACLVHLTLSDDLPIVDNNNTLLQVWMTISSSSTSNFYCSNNFTLLVDSGKNSVVIQNNS